MLCRLYEWKIEKELDETGEIRSPHLAHHLEKCPRCRAYHRHLIQLSEQLRSNMSCQLDESEFQQIHTTVQKALSDNSLRQTIQTGLPTHTGRQMPLAVLSVAAILVLSAIANLWFLVNRPEPSESVSQLSFDSKRIQAEAALLLQAPERSIQGEIQNLSTDIKYAFNFIQNCVPTPLSENAQNLTEHN
jgi:anti-sigma factor RsiW